MSDERDRPLSIDPFLGDDPEAIARERRRQQREARRRARSENRKSLGERVSGIRFYPDGSATGGRVSVSTPRTRMSVDVNWLTGKVRILDDERA